MPLVTGTLTDFGLKPLADQQPQLVFTPQEASTKNGRLLATAPVLVTPQPSGYFEVDLVATAGLVPETWYELTILWLTPGGGFDHPRWRITVPAAGGQIGTLLSAPAGSGAVFIGSSPPPMPSQYTWWIDPTTLPLPTLHEWTN